jgi:hypothetical protein
LNNDKSKDNYKNNYTDAQGLTGHSISDFWRRRLESCGAWLELSAAVAWFWLDESAAAYAPALTAVLVGCGSCADGDSCH